MEQSTAPPLPLTQSPQHHLSPPTFPILHLLPSPSITSYLPRPSPPTFPVHHLLPSLSITSYLPRPSPPTFTTLSRSQLPLATTRFDQSQLTACSNDPDLPQKGVRQGSLASHRSGLLPLSVTYIAGLKALEAVSAHAEAPEILISSPGP